MGEEQHRATRDAKRDMKARPVTAPSHEAGIARYLGAQHYREQKAYHEPAQPTAEPVRDTDDEGETEEKS